MSEFGIPLYPTSVPKQNTVSAISGTTTIGAGAAAYGKAFLITGFGGFTITLPLIDAVNYPSQTFTISNTSTSLCTITIAGSDVMYFLGGVFNSIAILPGERMVFQNVVSGWNIGLESGGRAVTPSQFDNTTKIATTQFVTSSGVQFGTLRSVTATGTTVLTAADIGTIIQARAPNGGASQTFTLPSLSSVPLGSTISFNSVTTNGVNIAAAGGNTITSTGAILTGGISLGAGNDAVLVAASSTSWVLVLGSGQLQYSQAFAGVPNANGYQKFPNGLLLQWGVTGNIPASSETGVTFPLAFNTLYSLTLSAPFPAPSTSVTLGVGATWASATTSIIIYSQGPSQANGVGWMAIGV